MTQDDRWREKYKDVLEFIKTNHRNPSKYDPEERYKYCSWIKHNKKLLNNGELKESRRGLFDGLLSLIEQNKHKNQYI